LIEIPPRQVATLSYIAAATNLVASAAMFLWLRPGLPVPHSSTSTRIGYIAEHAPAWTAGWLLWHAAALSLLALFAGLAVLWWRKGPIRCTLAMACAAAGLGADLLAETIYIGVIPGVDPEQFLVAEKIAGLLTGYLGNGLYTLAGILVTWTGASLLPRPLVALGCAVWVSASALSLCTIAGFAAGQLWTTAILMPLFIIWSCLVGRWLKAGAAPVLR